MVRGSELVDEMSSGNTAGPNTAPCSPATRFQAGSISKQVLSVVVLGLVAQKELHLDAAISRWWADVPARWASATLHQLLSHTSGLGHWGDIPGLPSVINVPPGREELLGLIGDAPPVYPPAVGWRYSGPGFLLAGLAVEAATGRPYGQVATELVFRPAGMAATTSGHYPARSPDVALGHHAGQPVEVQQGFARLVGTGDLWTTTADLGRFGQALRSGALIPSPAADQLWTPHAELPPFSDAADGPVVATAYGYGTFLGRVRQEEAWYVPGDNPGYQSLLAHLPGRGLDITVLCNDDDPGVEAPLNRIQLQ